MKPMDSSDTTWLAYSDYLEENGQFDFAQEIRKEITENNNNKHLLWNYEWRTNNQVGGDGDDDVGGGDDDDVGDGDVGLRVGDGDVGYGGVGLGGYGVGGDNRGGRTNIGRVVGGG